MLVTYLQMLEPLDCDPPKPPRPEPTKVSVQRKQAPTAEQYLHWYRGVGDDWNWGDRLRMDAGELTRYLAHPDVEVWVLQVGDSEAGYCELDRRTSDVEIVYFGLFPDFIGRGLGKWFLDWSIRRAWTERESSPASPVNRVWLHTCEGDHPAALPNYQRAGFEIYQVRNED